MKKKKERERAGQNNACVAGQKETTRGAQSFTTRGGPFGEEKEKKKGCCLFDCVKATSSFMLIPIISEGEGATVAD